MKKISFVLLAIAVSISIYACRSGNNSDNESQNNDNKMKTIVQSGQVIPVDIYGSGQNTLYVTLVGHGSLMFEYHGQIIHVDPYSAIADYSRLPKADLILLTHEHADHLDKVAIEQVREKNTRFIVSKTCNEILGYGDIISNGNKTEWNDIKIEAVPAYNIVHKKPNGEYYHPKNIGNGYILTFGDLKVYVAGDTENIPEMDNLKGSVDIAFLPKNIPYTMTDDMFVDAAKKISPKILYPYHFSEFDKDKIGTALDGLKIKLEIRPMSNN